MGGKRYGDDRIWKGEVENKNKGALWFPTFFLSSRPIRPKPSAFKKVSKHCADPLDKGGWGGRKLLTWNIPLSHAIFCSSEFAIYTPPSQKKRKEEKFGHLSSCFKIVRRGTPSFLMTMEEEQKSKRNLYFRLLWVRFLSSLWLGISLSVELGVGKKTFGHNARLNMGPNGQSSLKDLPGFFLVWAAP